jgi:hypothetical protein
MFHIETRHRSHAPHAGVSHVYITFPHPFPTFPSSCSFSAGPTCASQARSPALLGTFATAPLPPDVIKVEAVNGECNIGRNMQCRHRPIQPFLGDLRNTCTNVYGQCDQIWIHFNVATTYSPGTEMSMDDIFDTAGGGVRLSVSIPAFTLLHPSVPVKCPLNTPRKSNLVCYMVR